MSSKIGVFSDFDDTITTKSAGKELVKSYLLHNLSGESIFQRARLVLPLLPRKSRLERFSRYYTCLRRIPLRERKRIVQSIPIRQEWIRVVSAVRNRLGLKEIDVTIITGNCLDVVHYWISANRALLKKNKIKISTIISNGPLEEEMMSAVREHARHIDHVGFGQLMGANKREFLDGHTIYIGDAPDEVLRPYVKEYVRV